MCQVAVADTQARQSRIGDSLNVPLSLGLVLPTLPDNDKAPDLNITQLIALAILHTPGQAATHREIWEWICVNFLFYRKRLFEESYERHARMSFFVYTANRLPLREPTLFELVEDVLWMQNDEYEPVFRAMASDKRAYKIAAGKERLIFEKWNRDMSRPFPFLELPAELRSMVYESVLTYPSDCKVEIGRGDAKKIGGSAKIRLPDDTLKKPGKCVVSLLGTSKQVRSEALKFHYRFNHLSFSDINSLCQFFDVLGPECKGHITYVPIKYVQGSAEPLLKKVFSHLLKLENLTRLSMTLQENQWLSIYESIHKLPGFSVLRRLRGIEELTFEGDYAKTKKYLEKFLQQPRPGPKIKKEPKPRVGPRRKRKREQDDGNYMERFGNVVYGRDPFACTDEADTPWYMRSKSRRTTTKTPREAKGKRPVGRKPVSQAKEFK